MTIQNHVVLAPFTSWQIGGSADFFCLPETEVDLLAALNFANVHQLPITILGGGSNVLISDRGVRGLVIGLKKYSKIDVSQDENHHPPLLQIECLAGTDKSELLKVFLKHQLSPALFLAGLPGDVGGGVVMNAGVAEGFSPREFGELITELEVWRWDQGSLHKVTVRGQDIHWEYRHSMGWQPGIISKVKISWPMVADPSILEKVRSANRLRLQKQPLDKPSCGSVFVNPPQGKAAQLIDACGLKGTRIGDAEVSTKHANFIVNLGCATASDTWKLIKLVQNTVNESKQVLLRTEVLRLGDWTE